MCAVRDRCAHAEPATDYIHTTGGHADERGESAGLGANLNLPLPRGTGWDRYAAALEAAKAAIRAARPDLLVVSFGADAFAAIRSRASRCSCEDPSNQRYQPEMTGADKLRERHHDCTPKHIQMSNQGRARE